MGFLKNFGSFGSGKAHAAKDRAGIQIAETDPE
jgi:hypothetical protein